MPNTDAATMFLTTLNGLHPSLSFTMELPVDDRIPFIAIDIIKNLKLESIESQPTLACSYISTVILINAIKTLC